MNSSKILILILRLFVAALLGWAGFLKLASAGVEIELFTSLDMEPYGRYLIGVLELAAAILVLLPQSIVQGAVLAWGLMAGAVLAHLTRIGFTGQSGILFGAALAALVSSSIIIFHYRGKNGFFRRMFNSTQDNS